MAREDALATWTAGRLKALVLDLPALPAPPKNVVVGIDGTEDSGPPTRWARTLADQIHLVYAAQRGYPGAGSTPESLEALSQDARFAFDLVAPSLGDAEATEHTLDASPGRGIVEVAAAEQADLLLVSLRHHRIGEAKGLGTVTEILVHHAPYPVLLAREEPGAGPVVVAVGEDRSSRLAAAWGVRMALALDRDLVLLHAAPDDLEAMDLDTFASETKGAQARLVAWPPAQGLLEALGELSPSLLVVGHGRQKGWLGSTALVLLREADCSVLVVPWGRGDEADW